jgi:hypothetical protein
MKLDTDLYVDLLQAEVYRLRAELKASEAMRTRQKSPVANLLGVSDMDIQSLETGFRVPKQDISKPQNFFEEKQ